jgi:hypothetical protein
MAKGQYLNRHQKGIVKRYYQNRETLATQKLGELVSELYLEENQKKRGRLWKRVETALLNAGAKKSRVGTVVGRQDLKALADMVAELF